MRRIGHLQSRRLQVRVLSPLLHGVAALCIFLPGYAALAAGSGLKIARRLSRRFRSSHNVAATSWSHLGRIPTPIVERSPEGRQAYLDGFDAGAKWALKGVEEGSSVPMLRTGLEALVRLVEETL